MSDKKITEQSLRVFERFSKYISEHGYFNTIANLIMFFVAGIIIYCTFNPDAMFERYDRYVETKTSTKRRNRQIFAKLRRKRLPNATNAQSARWQAYTIYLCRASART